MALILWVFRRATPGKVTRGFRYAQSGSAAAMAFGHGLQDAAKTMGVVVLALTVGGYHTGDSVPLWVLVLVRHRDQPRHLRRWLADHAHARPQDHPPRPAAGLRRRVHRGVHPVHRRPQLRCPDLHHAHDHLLDHGRRRDQAAPRGPLGRGQEHRRRLDPHLPRRRPRRRPLLRGRPSPSTDPPPPCAEPPARAAATRTARGRSVVRRDRRSGQWIEPASCSRSRWRYRRSRPAGGAGRCAAATLARAVTAVGRRSRARPRALTRRRRGVTSPRPHRTTSSPVLRSRSSRHCCGQHPRRGSRRRRSGRPGQLAEVLAGPSASATVPCSRHSRPPAPRTGRARRTRHLALRHGDAELPQPGERRTTRATSRGAGRSARCRRRRARMPGQRRCWRRSLRSSRTVVSPWRTAASATATASGSGSSRRQSSTVRPGVVTRRPVRSVTCSIGRAALRNRSGARGRAGTTTSVGRQRDEPRAVDRHRQAVQQGRTVVGHAASPVAARRERGHEQQVLAARRRHRTRPRPARSSRGPAASSSPRRSPGRARQRLTRPSACGGGRERLVERAAAATRSSTRRWSPAPARPATRPAAWRLWTDRTAHRSACGQPASPRRDFVHGSRRTCPAAGGTHDAEQLGTQVRPGGAGGSAEAAGDVVLGGLLVGLLKIFWCRRSRSAGRACPVAARLKKPVRSRDPGRLLHVVGDDDDRVLGLQLVDQVLDRRASRSGRAPSTARPSAAPAGSTAIARAMHSRCCWPPERPAPGLFSRSLTSFQRFAPLQRLLDDVVGDRLLVLHAVEPQAGQRRCRRSTSSGTGWAAGRPCRPCGARRPGRRRRRRGPGRRADLALDPRAGDHLVHPVQRAQEGRLAAAGRADEGRHRARLDGHRDVLDGVEVAVVDVEVRDVDALGHGGLLLS